MILFDEDTHTYTVNGEVKRSVTQILRDTGITGTYDIPEYYRDLGTLVHRYCTLYAQGWLDMDSVREDCISPVTAFKELYDEMGMEYVSAEEPCYDEEYDVCGTYDIIVMWNGKRTLLELKTGKLPMWVGLQCAAYERMIDVDDVLAIGLKDKQVMTKGEDYELNGFIWNKIVEIDMWKRDRSRRNMMRV